jgi:hypothetical protein
MQLYNFEILDTKCQFYGFEVLDTKRNFMA